MTMQRNESLELLRQQHAFPGPFDFRVVVRKGTSASVVSAMVAAAGAGALVKDVQKRMSSKGSYEALVVSMHIGSAELVLDVYSLVGNLSDVVTAM